MVTFVIFPWTFIFISFPGFGLRRLFLLGDAIHAKVATSQHFKNVQSTSFRLLQRALESDNGDIDNTIDLILNCHAKAPKIKHFEH